MKRYILLLLLWLCVFNGDYYYANPSLNIAKISGVTMWLDASYLPSITKDSSNRVSAWTSRVGTISFTQSTDASKPILSPGDSRENLVPYSEAFDNAEWIKYSNYTAITANATTAPDGTNTAEDWYNNTTSSVEHLLYRSMGGLPVVSGQYYKFGLYAKQNELTRFAMFFQGTYFGDTVTRFNLASGEILRTGAGCPLVTMTEVGNGWYYCELNCPATGTGWNNIRATLCNADACPDYSGTVGDGIYIWGGRVARSNAHPVYVTTGASAYPRGHNGKPGMFFLDAQLMTSTARTSNMFAAGAKTIIVAHRPSLPNPTSNILALVSDTDAYWHLGIDASSSNMRLLNYDGSNDAVLAAGAHGVLNITEGWHDGVNLSIRNNHGAIATTASGNTPSLTRTLVMGNITAVGYTDSIFEIITFNRVLSEAERAQIYNYLKAKWGT